MVLFRECADGDIHAYNAHIVRDHFYTINENYDNKSLKGTKLVPTTFENEERKLVGQFTLKMRGFTLQRLSDLGVGKCNLYVYGGVI